MKCVEFYHPLNPIYAQLKFLQVDEQAYVYQRTGFQCLLETRFEDSGFCLFQGELNPRVLISYFPELRGALLDACPTVNVFSGIAEGIPPYDSTDDISTSSSPLSLSPPSPASPASAHPQGRAFISSATG
jgi:hypothetical protein